MRKYTPRKGHTFVAIEKGMNHEHRNSPFKCLGIGSNWVQTKDFRFHICDWEFVKQKG